MNVFEINNAIAEIENKDLDPEVLVDTIKSLELTRDQNWMEQLVYVISMIVKFCGLTTE